MRSWCKNTARSGQSTKSCPFKIPLIYCRLNKLAFVIGNPATECGCFATYESSPIAVSFHIAKTYSILPLTHEQTIRAAVTCKGIGLHSGAPVNLRILPAPAGTGIVFHRTDLDGFAIEASGRNVARVSYATSLMKKGVLISTTEHLLSAFTGVGIDNAIVELDNLELPILDGSARPFVEMIQEAGIRKQRKARTYLRIVRDIECARAISLSRCIRPTPIPFPIRSTFLIR